MNPNKTVVLLLFFSQIAAFSQSPREKLKFDFGWKFNLGDVNEAKEPGFNDAAWRTLDLPHDWSIELEFNARFASCTAYLPGGIGWYRKTFTVPENYRGKTVSLQFDGVYNNSEVWVNGHYLGLRPNGYIGFYYVITPYLEYGKQNVVSVRVDHSQYADTRWYSGSGIYRHVWLLVTDPVHVAQWGTYITTPHVSASTAEVEIRTTIANDAQVKRTVKIISAIISKDGKQAGRSETEIQIPGSLAQVSQTIPLANPSLWDVDNPYLYTLKTIVSDGKNSNDEYETIFGIRTLDFDPEAGFFLNGKNMKLKGVCLHHDGGCVGAAVPEKIWKIRLEKLKAAGCNAIRTSHNPVAPEFLDLCDRMGFMVMDEAFDEWEYAKLKWIDGWNQSVSGLEGYAQYFRQWAYKDLEEMIARDKNHPSIVMWSIGNEIDYANDPYDDPESSQQQCHPDDSINRPDAGRMVEIAQNLKYVIKQIDQTRPVTMALANIRNSRRIGLPEVLDIVGYNYSESRYDEDHKNHPGQFLYGSENPHNYDGWLAVKNKKFMSSQFLWTGVDYLGEAGKFPLRSAYSGLLDLTGHEKSIYFWRQSMWTEKPMLFITARKINATDKPDVDPMARLSWFVNEIEEKPHWNYRAGDSILAMAYTNCSEAELFLNGKSFGKKTHAAANSSIWWFLPYQAGEVKVVARSAGGRRFASFLRTVSEPVAICISADAKAIKADGQDVALIEVTLKDKNNNPAYLANDRVDFEVRGDGKIIGTDNGDAACLDNFKLPWRKAYQGRCIAVVQSTGKKGKIKITAKVAGIQDASIAINAE
jgi:beta-galactosidase